MSYLTRNEIALKLEDQFKIILANKNLTVKDAENLLFREDDVCDSVEPNSANYQFARELQYSFLIRITNKWYFK